MQPYPVRPSIEQLEQRCVPSAAAPPTNVHDAQTMPAVVQAVRSPVAHVDAVVPPTAAATVPQAPPIAVPAPPPVSIDSPPIALPLEAPAVPDVLAVTESMEQVRAAEPETPTPLVVVTSVDQEPEFVVPAAAEAHVEPVRAPSIPLVRLADERVAVTPPPARDHLPVLVWMVGVASLVAPRVQMHFRRASGHQPDVSGEARRADAQCT
jgi:hypothetical protein